MYLVIEYRDVGRYYGKTGVYSPTGNFSETYDDMKVQTVLGSIGLGRTYNSLQDNIKSIVGSGFTFNYAMKVLPNNNGVAVIMPNGAHWKFNAYEAGKYTATDNRGTLTLEENKYKLLTLDMTEYGFDTNGYLEYIKDEYGNQINILTDSAGKINKITDDSGTNIKFTYSGDLLTKIEEMKEVDKGEITETIYTYDKNNRLLTKQEEAQTAITYSYDANGNMTGKSDGTVKTFDNLNRMTGYLSANGVTTTYSYYPDNMRKSKKVGTDAEIGRFVSEDPAFDGSNWYVYCGNDPVNMIDPTGMWKGAVHKEITSKAYIAVRRKYYIKYTCLGSEIEMFNKLLAGCVYPDKARNDDNAKTSNYYKDGRWHGHRGYKGAMKKQLNDAVKEYTQKGNYRDAFFEIGKGLHTLQDYYAHNVMLDGEMQAVSNVVDGKFDKKKIYIFQRKKANILPITL